TAQNAGGPQRIAVVVDATMSMRATYSNTTSFARAIRQARNLIDAMGPEDMAVIVGAASPPQVMVPRPIASKATLLDRLDDLKPSYGPGDLSEAVNAAVQALAVTADAAPPQEDDTKPAFTARVVVLSDLAPSSLQGTADLRVPGTQLQARLEIIDVLAEVPTEERQNRAITAMEAVHVPDRQPRTVEVRTRLQSYRRERESDEPVPIELTLRRIDRELTAASAEVVPGTIVDKVIRHSFDTAGTHPIAVAMEPDILTEDDVRYGQVSVRRQVRVLVVDGAPSGVPKEDEVFYLERALAAGAADQPPARVIGADDLSRADLSGFDVVVLAGVDTFNRSESARLTRFVESGGGLLITVSESLDADLYNAELGALLPRQLRGLKVLADGAGDSQPLGLAEPDGQQEDPITQMFKGEALGGLLSTRTNGFFLLQPSTQPAMNVHLRFTDGQPALVSRTMGTGRVAVLTTSIDRDLSDLAIRPAFVPLMRQLILYLGRALDTAKAGRTVVGQVRTIRIPSGAMRLRVTAPDGRETEWASSDIKEGAVRYEDVKMPGHYTVEASFAGSWAPVDEEHFAANIDSKESDLQPLSIEEAYGVLLGASSSAQDRPAMAAAGLGRSFDPEALAALLLLIMALAFVTESALSAIR
ncbi:MAG: VWA domain-containing protein, partial [Myxococcota bacterium]